MEKNMLKYTAVLTLLVLGTLLAMHFLPGISLGGRSMRQVDMLSDVRPLPEPDEEDTLVLPPPPVVKPAFVDTCREGMTCIEDYSDSTERGMSAFYRALDEVEERPVRIAYFGDSFIEGDILTADLREMLQKRYGGCGTGYVDITSKVYGYRPTVRHAFSGWEEHSVLDSVPFDSRNLGIAGRYFMPRPGAYVELWGQKSYASRLDTCRRAELFFQNKSKRAETVLSIRVNGGEPMRRTASPSDDLQSVIVEAPIGSIRCTVEQADSAVFYGLAMDDVRGIAVDNFSLRGASGLSIRNIPLKNLSDFNRLRPYDLIVVQYGLNVATERGRNYDAYAAGMKTAIAHLKEAFPSASILVVSVGDRDYKDEQGELRTMPGIRNLVRYQQHIAAESAVAFWNLFEAMGGNGSMAGMVAAKPSLANRDYTHINFRGGKHLAGLLYDVLVYGKEQYDRRRAYEGE